MSSFHEASFRQKIDKALETVHKILDLTRTPRYAEDEDHVYDDKYGLAEFLTNSAISAQMNVFERMGLLLGENDGDDKPSSEKLQKLMNIVHDEHRSVTLRLIATESCEFVKQVVVDVESPHQHVAQVTETKSDKQGIFTKKKDTTYHHKVITKVKEHHWNVGVSYTLFCYGGNDPDSSSDDANRVILQSRESSTTIITTGDKQESPLPKQKTRPPIDVALTWLLQNLKQTEDGDVVCNFEIDRTKDKCRTPRRNEDIDEAITFFDAVAKWSHVVRDYFCTRLERQILGLHHPAAGNGNGTIQPRQLHSINANQVFVPVLPLMEAPKEKQDGDAMDEDKDDVTTTTTGIVAMTSSSATGQSSSSPLLSLADINKFLKEQCRSLDEEILSLAKAYPNKDDASKVLSVAEATQVLLCLHSVDIKDHWLDGIQYIEQMLRNQLTAAIGKEIHPKDFDEFIRFHNQKLLGDAYKPRPFCYAIRRPNHYPDGIVSIEGMRSDGDTADDKATQPIESIVCQISGDVAAQQPMLIPINAATSVEFTGERYLHAWIHHRFAASSNQKNQFKLVARARQFSSFLLMVGTIAGANKFDPKDAIILQNKDEVLIPLLLNELPTAKEFKDAIASLSPEQQRFAKSFRGMQLESSVFGVCVVQLKPQLEALLNLPQDALTKEIGLTQDLLSLFIDYQIPSDLLSFDGSMEAPVVNKVDAVKGYVKSVKDVIENEKTKQLEEAAKAADMRAEEAYPPPPVQAPAPMQHHFYGPAGRAAEGAMAFLESTAVPACCNDFMMADAPPPVDQSGKSSNIMPSDIHLCDKITPQRAKRRAAAPTRALQMRQAVSVAPMMMMEKSAFVDNFDECCVDFMMADAPPPVDQSFMTSNIMPSDITQSDKITPQDMADVGAVSNKIDFTAIPKKLNATFEKHDTDSALRTTIIKAGDKWTRARQANLLTKKTIEKVLGASDQKAEKNKAFDLLDALSRSGTLPIACAELHVVLGVTHCFENTVMGTVIEDNVNPIEKMEKSTLMIASTIHSVEVPALLEGGTADSRLMGQFPPALTESSEATT